MTAAEVHRQGVFARDGGVCDRAHLGGCRGEPQADHVISRQTIKLARSTAIVTGRLDHPLLAVELDAILADPRNGRVRCENHHHHPHLTDTRADISDHVEAFAADYNLLSRLDRDYGPREVAA